MNEIEPNPPAPLAPEELKILTYMHAIKDPLTWVGLVSDSCGHKDEPEWSRPWLEKLAMRGLIQHLDGGSYEITKAGRAHAEAA
jgi:hypothetical protein